MEESTTREKVLKKIRAALLSKTTNPYPRIDHDTSVYATGDDDSLLVFAEQLTEAGGAFVLCKDDLEFVEAIIKLADQYKWKNFYCCEKGLSTLLNNCAFNHTTEFSAASKADVVISSCECLIARTGTVVFSSQQNTRLAQTAAPVQIVFARASQLAYEIKDAVHWLRHKYSKLPSNITFSTGASRVINLGGETVSGAHTIQQLYVFLIDDTEFGETE